MVVGQLGRGQGPDAGEGDLAEPEHAALARDDCPRQQDDGVGEAGSDHTHPIALHDQGHDADRGDEEHGPAVAAENTE